MLALQGLTWLLVFQSLGELVSKGLGLPLPSPVVGMGMLWSSAARKRAND